MNITQNIEKLKSPIFEAFSKSVDQQYIYICDVNTNIWRWSQYAVDCFGLPGEYVEDLPSFWMQKVHPDDRAKLEEEFEKLFGGEAAEHSCEYRVQNADGKYMWVLCRGCMVRDENGAMELCAGILTDLGSKNKFDPMTGLYSFSEFQIAMDEILKNPCNRGSVLLWGIDYFRRVNDAHQYSFGNELLSAYAKRLINIVSDDCILYRMGGDEFAAVCPNMEKEEMKAFFDKIAVAGINGVVVDGKKQRFTISGGAALYPDHGENVDVLYTNLEYALEYSKKHKREGLTFFKGHSQQESLRIFRLQQKLRESVRNGCDDFHLCYQPLVGAGAEGELVGAEALLRWSNAEFPNVSPVDFIPLLEESGDINVVGKWVLSTAIKQMKEWLAKKPEMKISINVSYIQLKDVTFKDYVLEQLDKYDFPKKQLMLELTESCNVINPAELAKELIFFRQQGIQIALDDFGTGYASLSILRDLSADWIKVDHTFVAQITDNNYDQALLEYLINLCKKLGLNVCVEGVETEAIQNVIQQYKPTVLQGYYYSRPVIGSVFEREFID